MARITKKAQILEHLHTIVEKEAALAQTNIPGVPGQDTNFTSVSDETETTDKNGVGPEKLNDQQGYEQHPSSDSSEPVAVAKSASELEKMADQILGFIQTKMGQAQTSISGKPGADTNITSVSDSTENTNKNDVGPEKLNDEQGYDQNKSKDSSEPSKAKSAEELQKDKVASYNLGVALCDAIMKKASEIQQHQAVYTRQELLKEAGRRDLDVIINHAAQNLAPQPSFEQEKYAEEQGAAAFDALLKQAEYEALVEERQLLAAKVAHYEELEKQAMAQEAFRQKQEDFEKIAELVTQRLRNEFQSTPAA